jgi:indolepyruvate decarboxylase
VITQPLWASIGYSLPAALGTALAAPERRHILLIGDGACQLTAAEIGTIGRAGAHPLVLVLDNGGYAIEDAIHPTTADYNSIAPWDHALLPTAFQVADHWTTATVRTPAELHLALDTAEHTRGRATLVRLVLPRDDYPAGLAEIAARKRA